MRFFLKTALSVIALMLLAGVVSARNKKDFEKFLSNVTDIVKNVDNVKKYEKLEFYDKTTGEKVAKKFADFTEIQRHVFILMQIGAVNHELEELYNKWKDELKSAEDMPEDPDDASKAEVTEYLEKLTELRKKNAAKLEKLSEELFKKWPDKFSKDEQELYMKTIRDYHDKHKLIKRD